MFFNICGAYLIGLTEEADTFFYLPLGTGAVFAVASFVYPKPSEGFIHTKSLKGRHNTFQGFKDKVALIKQFLNVKDIRNSLIFFAICSIIMPNYEEFLFSYNESIHHIELGYEGIVAISLGLSASFLILLYNTVLAKKVDIRKVIAAACVFRLASAVLSVFQTRDSFAD